MIYISGKKSSREVICCELGSVGFLNTMYLLDRYKKYLAKDKANYFMRKIKIILSFAKISFSENNYYFFLTLIKYIIKLKKA